MQPGRSSGAPLRFSDHSDSAVSKKTATAKPPATRKPTGALAATEPTPPSLAPRWVETEPGIFRLDDEQRLPGGWARLRVA